MENQIKNQTQTSLPILSKWVAKKEDYENTEYLTLEVKGSMMYPYISGGDFIKVRPQSFGKWIQFGHPYFIITPCFAFVTRIYQGSSPDKWLLKFDNSESFPGDEIEISQVSAFFIVTQILKKIAW